MTPTDDGSRPDPDALLERIERDEARSSRGKLKIFFGASAGVGKTYAMLEAARKRKSEGADVVVGYVEPHGRAETEKLLEGLEQLAFRRVDYRGAQLHEFDLDAALVRKPGLILVDEFAHSNAAGSRHEKRWQDVEELLGEGINVYTTVNVQHIESLNDVVMQITGSRMQETVPDHVFEQADEVELIDITPDELLERLRAGKVYVPERAQHALQNFFRKGNLMALRELALRATADRVDAEMEEYREGHSVRGTWAAGERLLVCVGPDSQAERLVRAGKRMAAALHAEWMVVYVETPELLRMNEEERNRRIDVLRMAESLGAETVTLDGPTAAQAILEYARTRNVNRILTGRPNRRGWKAMLRPSTTVDLARGAIGQDIHIIGGDEAGNAARNPVLARSSVYLGVAPQRDNKPRWKGYAWAAVATAVSTAVCWPMVDWFDLSNLVMIYLMGAILVALRHGRGPGAMVASLNVVAFDFFFVPPRFSFAVSDSQYLVTFAVMLIVALVIGGLAANVRLQARVAGHRERRTALLYAMSRELASAQHFDDLARIAVRHTGETFDSQVVLLLPDEHGKLAYPRGDGITGSLRGADLGVAQWALDHGRKAGLGTDTLPGADAIYVPLSVAAKSRPSDIASVLALARARAVLAVLPANPRRILLPEQLQLLETFAAQIGLALERIDLSAQAQRAEVATANERIRNALLSAISHDLRTPLSVIAGSASTIAEGVTSLGIEQCRRLARDIYDRAAQMTQLINNILDLTRLEAGARKLNRQWQLLEEIVGAVLHRMEKALGDRKVVLELPEDLPLINVDAVLVEQVLANLIENILKYTPAASPFEIRASSTSDGIAVSVADSGPGIAEDHLDHIFDKFFRGNPESPLGGAGLGLAICRAIVEAHGGTLGVENRPGGGALFRFTLPRGGTPPGIEGEPELAGG